MAERTAAQYLALAETTIKNSARGGWKLTLRRAVQYTQNENEGEDVLAQALATALEAVYDEGVVDGGA